MKDSSIINPTGTVIITFDSPAADQWTKGFAVILDGDLSMLDTLSFTPSDKKTLDAVLKSYYKDLDAVEFCTNDPEELKDWYPESKKITSSDFLSARYDADTNRATNDMDLFQQGFDMLRILVKKTGTW